MGVPFQGPSGPVSLRNPRHYHRVASYGHQFGPLVLFAYNSGLSSTIGDDTDAKINGRRRVEMVRMFLCLLPLSYISNR